MSSEDYFVIAHWVYLQPHPTQQTATSPRELLTTADTREDAIEAAKAWASDRIHLPTFDQEKWDERLKTRVTDHIVPPNEKTGTTGGMVTFVDAAVHGLGDKWRSGDSSTAQAIVMQMKYAQMFPEFMFKK